VRGTADLIDAAMATVQATMGRAQDRGAKLSAEEANRRVGQNGL